MIPPSHGLNPALVGRDLPDIYNGFQDLEARQAYLVLMTGDQTGDMCFQNKISLESLMPRTLCRAENEVVSKDSNNTLNIHNNLGAPHVLHTECG